MDVEGGDPSRARLKNLEELLADEIVEADGTLGGYKEDGFGGVELRCLREAF